MPQKRNPMLAQNIVALSKLLSGRPALSLEAMMHEHERVVYGIAMSWWTRHTFVRHRQHVRSQVLKHTYNIEQILAW